MGRRTPLFELHQSLGARIVEFGGWDMPLSYSSLIEEHHAVRRAAGMFDVSHMGILDLRGSEARHTLERLLANDVGRLRAPGSALYSCMLNESGGVIDDLIVYYLGASGFRLVVNAATRVGDIAWIEANIRGRDVQLAERTDLALIAVQGPQARARFAQLLQGEQAALAQSIARFHAAAIGRSFVARTGYTGEDGFEVMLPAVDAPGTWRALAALEVVPCGLGARDTLRLEAGMNLYGSDLDASHDPLESGLAWTVAFEPSERDFIGRAALKQVQRLGPERKQVGLVLEDRGVLRAHYKVIAPGAGTGEVTSGTFSPTLERSIALARVPSAAGDHVQVDIRGQLKEARVVQPPFVRHGRSLLTAAMSHP